MGRHPRILLKLLLASSAFALPATALAQSTTAPTREEITRLPETQLPSNGGQRLTVEGGVERAPCPLGDAGYANIKLRLSGVEFAHLQGADAAQLKSSYARYIGQEIPLSTVCEIRDEAATLLRSMGYLAAVQVPPQRIEDGQIRFDVLMAKIVGFQVRGNAGRSERRIARYLEAIKAQPVFNIVAAERYLLLARDLPGFDVRLTLRPAGTVPGEVVGEVQVVRSPVELDVNVQSLGSHAVGRVGGIAQLRLNGVFGAGDRTSLGYYATNDFKEQHVLQVGEEVRVGREGLVLAANLTHAWTHPDLALNLRSRALVATFEARYPILRRQTRNIFVSSGFDLIDQQIDIAAARFSQDRLRVGWIRGDFDILDPESLSSLKGYSLAEPHWRLGGNAELRKGVGLFNASKRCVGGLCTGIAPSHVEGDPRAFVLRGAISGEFRPTPKLGVALSVRGQYTPHPLLSFEEFSAGNFTIGRGYDPGAIIGDRGVAVASELRYGSLVPRSNHGLALQGYGFVDSAWVWNQDSSAGNNPDRLVSAGLGLRTVFGDKFTLDVAGAAPLTRIGAQTKRGDIRLLVNLTMRLAPWKW